MPRSPMAEHPESAGESSPAADPPRSPGSGLYFDLLAFLAIAFVVIVTHRSLIVRGMCFNDPSWYFHFGTRTLHGDVPYRDYIFQVGPLPIYVDAAYQQIFGAEYAASLYAALTIKILRVSVIWMIARRLASWRVAAGVTVFCALDPLFSFAHHWSTAYAQLFIALAALWFLLAVRADGRRALLFLALAGFSASLVVSARQSAAVMIGATLFVATLALLVRGHYFTPRRFAALWGGFAAGFVCVFGLLAIAGALGPAIQQMFLDAPEKKAIHGVAAVLDALTGGAIGDWSHSWWGGLLTFIALPAALVGGAIYLLSRERDLEISSRAIALLGVPVALLLAALTRYASLDVHGDLPRTFLTAAVALAALAPVRARAWFGIEPVLLVALGALPLACDWALEMSFPGRGWGDVSSLVTGVLLIAIASARMSERAKIALGAVLAVTAALHCYAMFRDDQNPFAKREANDGTLRETRFVAAPRGDRHPMLRRLRLPRSRTIALEWLAAQIPPGSTCFVYGNTPVLYTLLGCTNPTRIDTTAADFITAGDGEEAVATLRRAPPDFIIAHERQWMSPPLTLDLGGQVERYDGLNPRASRAVHVGLRALLDRYDEVGKIGDVLGPQLAKQASEHWDSLDAVRLYRRKR